MTRLHIVAVSAAILLAGAQAAMAAPTCAVTDRIAVPDGGWDPTAVGPAAQRLHVARGAGVTVVDLRTRVVTPGLVGLAGGSFAVLVVSPMAAP